jgi:hypothetical protein
MCDPLTISWFIKFIQYLINEPWQINLAKKNIQKNNVDIKSEIIKNEIKKLEKMNQKIEIEETNVNVKETIFSIIKKLDIKINTYKPKIIWLNGFRSNDLFYFNCNDISVDLKIEKGITEKMNIEDENEVFEETFNLKELDCSISDFESKVIEFNDELLNINNIKDKIENKLENILFTFKNIIIFKNDLFKNMENKTKENVILKNFFNYSEDNKNISQEEEEEEVEKEEIDKIKELFKDFEIKFILTDLHCIYTKKNKESILKLIEIIKQFVNDVEDWRLGGSLANLIKKNNDFEEVNLNVTKKSHWKTLIKQIKKNDNLEKKFEFKKLLFIAIRPQIILLSNFQNTFNYFILFGIYLFYFRKNIQNGNIKFIDKIISTRGR